MSEVTDGRGNLPGWTAEQGRAFEVAEDVFGDLIAWCTEQLTAEEGRPDSDPAKVRHWQQEIARYAGERRDLDGTDPQAVAAVLATYGPIVRRLYHGVGDERSSQ